MATSEPASTAELDEQSGGDDGSSGSRRISGGGGIGDEFWGSFYAPTDATAPAPPARAPVKKPTPTLTPTPNPRVRAKPRVKPSATQARVQTQGWDGQASPPPLAYPTPPPGASSPPAPANLAGQAPTAPSVVTGRIERVVYRGDSGYTVAALGSVVAEGADAHLAEIGSGKSGTVTIVSNGCLAAVNVGDFLTCAGGWVQDRKYGTQFRVTDAALAPIDESIDGIRAWLLSGVIRGVGPAMTERILDVFGDRTHDVIDALADPNMDLAASELMEVR